MTKQKKWREKIEDLPPALEAEILRAVEKTLKPISNDPRKPPRETVDKATLASFPDAPASIAVERQPTADHEEKLLITYARHNTQSASLNTRWKGSLRHWILQTDGTVATLLNHHALRAGLLPFDSRSFPQRPPETEGDAKANEEKSRRSYRLNIAQTATDATERYGKIAVTLQYDQTKRDDLLAAVQSRLEELEQAERYRKNDALGTISDRHKWPAPDPRSRR